jgi:uncharacterized lipoprotein YmbA
VIVTQKLRHLSCGMLLATLNGCASPREHLYILDNQAADAIGTPEIRTTVLLGPVSVPQEVDRPQIVVRDGSSQLLLVEQQRWAAPLKDSLPRLLAAELDRNQRNNQFVPVASGAVATPKARLAIDVTRFDVSRVVGATVSAHWVYRSLEQGSVPIEGNALGQAPVLRGDYADLVEALRRASIQMAVHIAVQLSADR